jgi:glycosyltransferase involved in cell wall biosynthesis
MVKKLKICILCDLMFNLHGPVTPALHVAKAIAAQKHEVSIVSPRISGDVRKTLKSYPLNTINLNANIMMKNGPPFSWLEVWAREAFFNFNSKGFHPESDVVINFSHTIAVPTTVWYVQGPTTEFLSDTEHELPLHYRFPYRILKPLLTYADNGLVRRMASMSKFVIANSKFCASMYEKRGIKVHGIIYPPLDCGIFKNTSNPSGDYVLTYFGKETEFSVLEKIVDAGVKMKAFGSKTTYIPTELLKHKNIDFLGKISSENLVNLYSNAFFTLFTFTHEPFGYIPVESMACGTPVLTYDRQGPSETVVNGSTGWLADSAEEVARLAVRLWRQGYSSTMRKESRKRALLFNVKDITDKWFQIVEGNPVFSF